MLVRAISASGGGSEFTNPNELQVGTKTAGSSTLTLTFSEDIANIVLIYQNRYYILQDGNTWTRYDSQSSSTGDMSSVISVSGKTITLTGTWSGGALTIEALAWF